MQQVCNVNIRQVCVQLLPSVLWHCWLGGRKGIRSVKKLSGGVLAWLSVWSEQGADLHMAQLMPLPVTVSCFSKIQLVLHFWYQLTRVVLDKGPLNGCVCVSVFSYLRTQKTWHCLSQHDTAAATDRYLPPAWPTAANLLHSAAVSKWDRRTGTETARQTIS